MYFVNITRNQILDTVNQTGEHDLPFHDRFETFQRVPFRGLPLTRYTAIFVNSASRRFVLRP